MGRLESKASVLFWHRVQVMPIEDRLTLTGFTYVCSVPPGMSRDFTAPFPPRPFRIRCSVKLAQCHLAGWRGINAVELHSRRVLFESWPRTSGIGTELCRGFPQLLYFTGSRGGAVGWGSALQVGRSRVRFPMLSLEFFVDIILPAALWRWGRLSL